ncbi:MAG: hypothetical protein E7Z80_05140 [Methanobrevibacter thaueri]|nr:hypothetical protein [Methanobrevibacter thaueri]
MFLFVMGAVSAIDSLNVQNTEDSNLMEDNEGSLSENNKLEISSEVSVSQTNIVNSHDDDLGDYPNNEVKNYDSYYEDNEKQSTSIYLNGENTSYSNNSSTDLVVTGSSSNNVVCADNLSQSSIYTVSQVSSINISDTHYTKSATYFEVTLKDMGGRALANQKLSLKVNGKDYSAYTDANGIALFETACLKVGSYTVSVNYEDNSISKKVKVLSSVMGSDVVKYCGHSSKFKMTFYNGTNVLSNTKVTYKIKGKTYTTTTNDNGVAKFKVKLPVGKYTVTITNPVTKEKVSYKIKVKKDSTALTSKSKTYVHSKSKGSFSVVLKSKHGALLKHKTIHFTFNHKKVTSKTNGNGKATITIPVLSKGTHKIKFHYDGSDRYYSSSGSADLVVRNPTTKVSASNVKMTYHDDVKFKVKLTTSKGKALANKNVKIKIRGKTYTNVTDRNGNAFFSLKNVKAGNHNVKYHYSSKGLKDYSQGSNKVTINKGSSKITAEDLKMELNDGSAYQLTVKDKKGNLLKGVFVKSVINGKSFFYQTNDDGVAKLKITLDVGYYKIKSTVVDSCYKSSTVTKHVLVNGYKFVGKNVYVSVGENASYSVKVLDPKNNPVSNENVIFSFNGVNISSTTNEKGVAKVELGELSKGTYKIKYACGSFSDSSKVYAVNKVTVNDVLDASKSIKKYISKHSKLPSTVQIGDVSFKTADYLNLASQTIVSLKKGKKDSIPIRILDNPKKPKDANNLGYLKDYLSVAKKVIKTAESKGILPNSVSSKIGSIGYKGIVSAFSRVLSYYDSHDKMPSYVAIKALSGSSGSSSGVLNTKNKIKNLAAYLASSKNCQVSNDKIKKLVTKLTKGCKTDKQKAKAIFNYVRDTISYSFYFNTKHGAAGTLKAKSGNCVDHAHLIVAMCRCAGLATRYVHGTCHFNSGHTYGHVWAQVLIGNTWTVADATSSRNSLGKVANWNTHSYKLQGYFAGISF